MGNKTSKNHPKFWDMGDDDVEGHVSLERFKKCELLGHGSFGKCYLVCDGKSTYALKSIKKRRFFKKKTSKDSTSLVWNERNILLECKCPFILNLEACLQTEEELFFLTKVFRGGDLGQRLKESHKEGRLIATKEATFYLAELVLALEHLHSKDIVHRDIKPENIFIDNEGHLALGDLGLAIKQDPCVERTIFWGRCGSYGYRAPEVIRDQRCGIYSDIYSLGITMYYFCFGGVPWKETRKRLQKEKASGTSSLFFPKNDNITDSLCSLLLKMLEVDRHRRITIPEIKAHPAMKWIDWDRLQRREIEPPWVPSVEEVGLLKLSKMAKALAKKEKKWAKQSCDLGEEFCERLNAEQQAKFSGFDFVRTKLLPTLTHSNDGTTSPLQGRSARAASAPLIPTATKQPKQAEDSHSTKSTSPPSETRQLGIAVSPAPSVRRLEGSKKKTSTSLPPTTMKTSPPPNAANVAAAMAVLKTADAKEQPSTTKKLSNNSSDLKLSLMSPPPHVPGDSNEKNSPTTAPEPAGSPQRKAGVLRKRKSSAAAA